MLPVFFFCFWTMHCIFVTSQSHYLIHRGLNFVNFHVTPCCATQQFPRILADLVPQAECHSFFNLNKFEQTPDRDTGGLRRHRAHYDVTVMKYWQFRHFTTIFVSLWLDWIFSRFPNPGYKCLCFLYVSFSYISIPESVICMPRICWLAAWLITFKVKEVLSYQV